MIGVNIKNNNKLSDINPHRKKNLDNYLPTIFYNIISFSTRYEFHSELFLQRD